MAFPPCPGSTRILKGRKRNMSRLMARSVAAWEDDGGARRPRIGISVLRSRNQALASVESPPVKKMRQCDGKRASLGRGLFPVAMASE